MFVLFIAFQTFWTTVKGGRIPYSVFVGLVVFTWLLACIISILGPILHGRTYWVRAGAWCWASALYETERLVLHYVWIFFFQAAVMIIYLVVIVHIRRTMAQSSKMLMSGAAKNTSHAKVERAARSMMLYAAAYVVLTLPLSAGRMWSVAHHGAFLPNWYICVAGTLIASSGLVDALMYTFTRQLLMSSGASTTDGNTQESLSKKRLSRPAIMRAISARSARQVQLQDAARNHSVPAVSRSAPDPYALDTYHSNRASSVPALPRNSNGSIVWAGVIEESKDNKGPQGLGLRVTEVTLEEKEEEGDVMKDKF